MIPPSKTAPIYKTIADNTKPHLDFGDLRERSYYSFALMAIGLGAVIAGHTTSLIIFSLIGALIISELQSIVYSAYPNKPIYNSSALYFIALFCSVLFLTDYAVIIGVLFGVVTALYPIFQRNHLLNMAQIMGENRWNIVFMFTISTAVFLSIAHLYTERIENGVVYIFWFVGVVVATDSAGYFFGKLIGGAKLCPSISEKKTWAGLLGGWVGAVAFSILFTFIAPTTLDYELILFGLLLSCAAQTGDLVESALKRRANIKDSSQLLAAHGGVFDRFDGFLGAATLWMLAAYAVKLF